MPLYGRGSGGPRHRYRVEPQASWVARSQTASRPPLPCLAPRAHQREATRGIRARLRPSRGFGVGRDAAERTPDGSPHLYTLRGGRPGVPPRGTGDRGRRRPWGPHSSITSRSSSSLLASLSSTPVCFPSPSKLLLLMVLEGVSGASVGCSGREGATRPLSACNPDAGHFPPSSLTGGQGTRASPPPRCPPDGRRASCLPSPSCKRAEPGAGAPISR